MVCCKMKIDLTVLHKKFKAELVDCIIGKLHMEKNNNRDYVAFLYDKRLITILEHDVLIKMIDSLDMENYEVAKIILQNKSENLKPCQ